MTVELDGEVPGLPTSSMPTPSHAWQRHARRPIQGNSITPDSEVKLKDIDFLRKVKHPDVETGARVKVDNRKGVAIENNEPMENPVSFSMRTKAEPKKKGIGYKVFYQKDGK